MLRLSDLEFNIFFSKGKWIFYEIGLYYIKAKKKNPAIQVERTWWSHLKKKDAKGRGSVYLLYFKMQRRWQITRILNFLEWNHGQLKRARAQGLRGLILKGPTGNALFYGRWLDFFCLVMFLVTGAKQRGILPVLTVDVAAVLTHFTTLVSLIISEANDGVSFRHQRAVNPLYIPGESF